VPAEPTSATLSFFIEHRRGFCVQRLRLVDDRCALMKKIDQRLARRQRFRKLPNCGIAQSGSVTNELNEPVLNLSTLLLALPLAINRLNDRRLCPWYPLTPIGAAKAAVWHGSAWPPFRQCRLSGESGIGAGHRQSTRLIPLTDISFPKELVSARSNGRARGQSGKHISARVLSQLTQRRHTAFCFGSKNEHEALPWSQFLALIVLCWQARPYAVRSSGMTFATYWGATPSACADVLALDFAPPCSGLKLCA